MFCSHVTLYPTSESVGQEAEQTPTPGKVLWEVSNKVTSKYDFPEK